MKVVILLMCRCCPPPMQHHPLKPTIDILQKSVKFWSTNKDVEVGPIPPSGMPCHTRKKPLKNGMHHYHQLCTMEYIRDQLGATSCAAIFEHMSNAICGALTQQSNTRVDYTTHPIQPKDTCAIISTDYKYIIKDENNKEKGTIMLHTPKPHNKMEYITMKLNINGGAVRNVMYQTHRVVCFICKGPNIGENKIVDHECNNKSCVNPLHLRWSNYKENSRVIDKAKDKENRQCRASKQTRDSEGKFIKGGGNGEGQQEPLLEEPLQQGHAPGHQTGQDGQHTEEGGFSKWSQELEALATPIHKEHVEWQNNIEEMRHNK
jgi:hypothetical protein